jgi:hypothetical protein
MGLNAAVTLPISREVPEGASKGVPSNLRECKWLET